jgi:hypothetical protein
LEINVDLTPFIFGPDTPDAKSKSPITQQLLRCVEGAERFLVLQYEEATSAHLNNAYPE